MKILKLLSNIITLAIVLVLGVACFDPQLKITPMVFSTPTSIPSDPTKQVTSISLPLVEKWRWSGLIYNSSGLPMVVISEDRIVIAANEFATEKVIVFDGRTGNTIWESGDIRNLRSLNADKKRVYVGSIRYVKAYDFVTGQELWEGAQQPSFKRGRLNVYPEGEELNVYDPYDSRLYILDAQKGQTIVEIRQPLPFFKWNNVYYSGVCGGAAMNCLNAVDALNGEQLWSHDFGGSVYSWPIFLNDMMFINAGGQLFAIKAKTGKIIWQSTGGSFVTPMALGDKFLYVIRDDAAIVGFEPKTGEPAGVIEVSPKQSLEYTGGYVPYYTIAASDKFVAAYYSNSQELIVFENADDVEN